MTGAGLNKSVSGSFRMGGDGASDVEVLLPRRKK